MRFDKVNHKLIPTCYRCHVAMNQGIAIGPTIPDYLKHALSDPGGHLINNETVTLSHLKTFGSAPNVDIAWICQGCEQQRG